MSSKTFITRTLCTDAIPRKLTRPCTTGARIATAMVGMLFFAGTHAGTSGNISLARNYVFRGVSQTNQNPALQGGAEYAADSGVYAGTWGSNISWLSDASTTLGVTKSFDSGFSVCLAYSDTDADPALYTNAFGNNIAGSALVLSVAKAF